MLGSSILKSIDYGYPQTIDSIQTHALYYIVESHMSNTEEILSHHKYNI